MNPREARMPSTKALKSTPSWMTENLHKNQMETTWTIFVRTDEKQNKVIMIFTA